MEATEPERRVDLLREVVSHVRTQNRLPEVQPFRHRHIAHRKVIDELIDQGFLRAEGASYRPTLAALWECSFPDATAEIEVCNRLLPALRELYLKHTGKQLTVEDIAASASMPVVDVSRALLYLRETSICNGSQIEQFSGLPRAINLHERVFDVEQISMTRPQEKAEGPPVAFIPHRLSLQPSPPPTPEPEVQAALEAIAPALAASYRQALRDLDDERRESFVGVATEMREVLTKVLHSLAPDDQVRAQQGWKPEGNDDRPTRRQRAAFILRTKSEATSRTVRQAIDQLDGGLDHLTTRLYDRASKSTHGSADSKELVTLGGYWRSLLRDLLL